MVKSFFLAALFISAGLLAAWAASYAVPSGTPLHCRLTQALNEIELAGGSLHANGFGTGGRRRSHIDPSGRYRTRANHKDAKARANQWPG